MASTVDPLEFVRRKVDWFFRSGRFDQAELVGHLVAEALRCGSATVSVRAEGRWSYVFSAEDWLGSDADAAFQRVVSYPEAGPNSMRAELLVTAFTSDSGTAIDGRWVTIGGSVPDDVRTSALALGEVGRVIVFRAEAY
jgi:hypothetical protein